MTISAVREYPVYWMGNEDGTPRLDASGRVLGWMADVPVALPLPVHQNLIRLALQRFEHMHAGLPPVGDQKAALGRAIEELRQGRLTENLVADSSGYRTAFASTERTGTQFVSLPGKPLIFGG